jgi:hypothetical protein
MANNYPKVGSRKIDDFKSKLVGGGARANLFEVEVAFPDAVGVNPDEDFRFMIKAAQLPASNVGVIDIPFRGRNLKVAGDRTFDPWTITVINDTNFKIRDAFERWMNKINKLDDNTGIITPASYMKDMKVYQLGRGTVSGVNDASGGILAEGSNMPVLKEYYFKGCFPSSISAIDLSYDSSDTIEEFTVDLQVQWYDSVSPVLSQSDAGESLSTGTSIMNF